MASQNKIPAAVDYTSRDYYSLRDDLIERVKNRVSANGKEWSANDPADFGVALVEAFAHVGDVTNYYIDRIANESYLSTANQRQNILNLAGAYGYKASGYRQSQVYVTFVNSSTTASVTVPAGTVMSVSIVTTTALSQSVVEELFTLQEDVSVPAADSNGSGSALGLAVHGQFASSLPANAANEADLYDLPGELLGYSNGNGNQQFFLKYNQVVDGTIRVFVRSGDEFVEWAEVPSLAPYDGTRSIYQVETDANNQTKIIFGDNVSGAVPVLGAEIKVEYVIGGGVSGNIDGGYTFTLVRVPVASGLTLSDLATITAYNASNQPAVGGEDPESNDSIRKNAPVAFRSLQRAVSLKDFEDLALSMPGVGKTAAYATTPTSVALYASPEVSITATDFYPGYKADNATLTAGWTEMQSDIVNFLEGKTQIGTTVTVLPPDYSVADVVIEYVKQPEFTDAQILSALRYQFIYDFGYQFLDFGAIIRPEKIEQSMSKVKGIESVRVLKLVREGGSGRNTLVAADGEYFVFLDGNLFTYPSASLSNLTKSAGTLSPAFSATTYAYTLALTNGTTSITVTPTSPNDTSVITVNGTTVTSGSASGSISTAVGTTTITIVVTSADGTTTHTYTISATRAS